ncbi:hypothetical protein GCM10027066_24410 [Dyella jejuensis]
MEDVQDFKVWRAHSMWPAGALRVPMVTIASGKRACTSGWPGEKEANVASKGWLGAKATLSR